MEKKLLYKDFYCRKGVCFILKRKWKTFDSVMAILLVISFCLFVFCIFLFSVYFVGNKQIVEEPIIGKFSEKGVYFGPFYKIVTEDKGESYVTKKQFYDVDSEDTVTGYQTNKFSFFTSLDIIYDGAKLMIIILILGILFFSFSFYFYDNFFRKKKRQKSVFQQREKWSKKLVDFSLILYVIITFIILLLVSGNLFHQIATFGQTNSNAKIIDEEVTRGIGRYATDTYEFYIYYSDTDENGYIVKKRINYLTYNKYKDGSSIPIHYQNKNPANIFIQLESITDVFSSLLSMKTFILLAIPYSYSFIYKRLKKNWFSSES